jgi:predicted alpha-1,2-mannosidase
MVRWAAVPLPLCPVSGGWRARHLGFCGLSGRGAIVAILCVLLFLTTAQAGPAQAGTARSQTDSSFDPAGLVDTFVGTGSNPVYSGAIGTFPGADVPFGMVQWSPDTSPNLVAAGGGYNYSDDEISGLSLTHLSGVGCSIFGDVPILPFTGSVPQNPQGLNETFSHAQEQASPGRYQVALGSPSVTAQLGVTTRSGIGTFTFPASTAANLLFKVSDSLNGIDHSTVQMVGNNEILGSVSSGQFCSTTQTYTVYFFATFDRPFTGKGVWTGAGLRPGASTCAGSQQTACGAWVSFDTESDPTVTMKVGISYVSTANAEMNLRAEDPGWNLGQVESQATKEWNAALGRIVVRGGSVEARKTFYTALYHSLLDPSVFSDVNGQYEGMDGRVHNSGKRTQYANFSEWDIYRDEIPLLSMIDPDRVSDMMQSLVDDATQTGSLPIWQLANLDTPTMSGDSADPVISDAYAFGVRGFNANAALTAMVDGANSVRTFDGVEQRPHVSDYNENGYVDNEVVGQDLTLGVGTSMTLEYAIDDFAIAEMAKETGHTADEALMMRRAQDWEQLFNPVTTYLQPRQEDGSFPSGPAFQLSNPTLQSLGVTQLGFQEGNALQYTWSVPQDLGELFALMGGGPAATQKLDQFLTELNAGPSLPYDWSGNEPDLWVPWEFDYSEAPWRTQAAVRQIASSVYSLTPDGEPGNDDLGAMAAWYVWADLGLYPLTPGTANLVVGSPLFPSATIDLGSGKRLELTADGAPDPYVRSATLATGSGGATALNRPWLPSDVVRTGGTVHFVLSSKPDKSWGAEVTEAPPSFGEYATPILGYTQPSGAVQDPGKEQRSVTVGVESVGTGRSTVYWKASTSSGITVSPSSGEIAVAPASGNPTARRASTQVSVTSTSSSGGTVRFDFSMSGSSATIPPAVLDLDP